MSLAEAKNMLSGQTSNLRSPPRCFTSFRFGSWPLPCAKLCPVIIRSYWCLIFIYGSLFLMDINDRSKIIMLNVSRSYKQPAPILVPILAELMGIRPQNFKCGRAGNCSIVRVLYYLGLCADRSFKVVAGCGSCGYRHLYRE